MSLTSDALELCCQRLISYWTWLHGVFNVSVASFISHLDVVVPPRLLPLTNTTHSLTVCLTLSFRSVQMEHRIFNCGPAARGTPAENSKYGAVYTILDKEISPQPLADREGARDTVHDRWLLKVSTDMEVTTSTWQLTMSTRRACKIEWYINLYHFNHLSFSVDLFSFLIIFIQFSPILSF